ncbi:glycosyltransferase family 4 protein [Salimicrobium sp. PL1-032A]|uniref:glycosyltransferase family 4 protein n=1 Tax=Salimicrobium sp. PL1-032A TaxID=3095364 RepID=UPI0032606650
MVDYIYKNTDKIFTTSRSFVDQIADRGVPKNKIFYWPQYSEEYSISTNEVSFDSSKFNIIFTGNIGESQGLDVLIETASLLQEEGKENEVSFNLVGEGRYKDKLIEQISERNLSSMFRLISKKSPEEIPGIISKNDVALISLKRNELFEKTIPAKLQTYMYSSSPILAVAKGEVENIIEASASGLSSEPGNPVGLKDNILKFMSFSEQEFNTMRENSLEFYNNNFKKRELMNSLDNHIITDINNRGE